MTATLLELTVAIVLVVAAWQIGLIIAPDVIRVIRRLGQDVETASDRGLSDTETVDSPEQQKEHTNGTHR